MKIKHAILGSICLSSTALQAAPNDLFLQAKDYLSKHNNALHITASVDAVNDTLDLFDIRESEGVTDKSAGDYQGFHIAAQYDLNPQWSIEGSLWQRELEYSKDTNKIQSGLLAISYAPDLHLTSNSALKLRASIWGNTADQLDKTTATRVNTYNFEQVKVNDPEDIQLQFDGIFSHKIDHMNQINIFAQVGYSEVSVGRLDLQTRYSGCPLYVNIDQNNQYKAQSLSTCPTTYSFSGDATDFGLQVQKDLNYTSYYAGFGGSWNLRYRKFESQLAYSYQRLWRQDIDDRITNFGNKAIKDNHSLGAKFSYDIHPKITPFFKAELYQNNFVGQIPFLYNGITASRLNKRYGLASFGVAIRHF